MIGCFPRWPRLSDGGEDGRVVGACIVSSECSLRCNADNERYGACRWGRLRPLVGRSVGRSAGSKRTESASATETSRNRSCFPVI